ncbi:MAG: glycosyltransferase [Candidatus Obscuribacter sp.]|nr:glycosyltransferase [Candidatus Obscuribacter sp.]
MSAVTGTYMQPRILILSASSGNGHIKAGEALAKAFSQAQPEAIVQHIDALTLVSPAMRNVYSRAYIKMVNQAPSVLGWLYNHLDEPYKDERRRLLLNRINSLPLTKKIVQFNPDIVVCTHFLPADIVSMLLASKRIHANHAVVITDLDAHAMWLGRNIDRYFVALPETEEYLATLGVPREHITVSGIPIDPAFAIVASQLGTAGSSTKIPTILVSAGGLGVGPVEKLIEQLNKINTPIEVIALCGKNKDLATRLNVEYANAGNMQLHALGYINNVHEYMARADMIIGKPGGLTTAEALACGLAFIIVNPIPGQEERNATHLLENGVAIRCNNMNTIAYKLQKLLSDDARLATLKNNARTMARPQAARDVATQLLKQWSAVNRTDSPALPIELAPTRRGYLRHLLPSANRAV